ncbi:MAG: polysaccharide biosynthesis tyrosine autokinase [Paludibacter sp.]|nr:polysaccharide biosynthesis tyrosine autokinase [Paludibacter sp.]
MNQNKIEKPFLDDEESNFDIMEWVFNFLHYWYLFVIGVIIALGLAYLQNRKWIPSYKTLGTIIIEEYKAVSNAQALMQGFGVQAGYSNTDNQVIMLGSNDLINRVIDSLPQLEVDYITKGNFKTRNIYNLSPISIQSDYIAPEAYNLLFKINLQPDGTYLITVDDDKKYEDFSIRGRIGEPVSNNLFFLTITSTPNYGTKSELYFRFRDKSSLVADFTSRLMFNYKSEGSSVLEVSLTSENYQRDIDFINKLFDTFLAENLERKNDAANKTVSFIDTQLEKVAVSLNKSQDEMTNFRQKNQLVNVETHTTDLITKATNYDAELSELRLREIYLNYLTDYLKTNLSDGDVIAPASLGLNEPMLMSLIQQINDLNLKRSSLSPKNFFYSQYTDEIKNVKKSINEVTKNMRAALNIEKKEFDTRYAKVQKEIEELPEKEIAMSNIERNYKMDDNYYTFFLQKRAEAEILKSSNTPDNEILDKARVVGTTNGDKKSKTTIIFLLIGVLAPALIVIIRELTNAAIRSTNDVEKGIPFKLIGIVRHTHSKEPLIVAKYPRSSFTEMFRVIRTRIEFVVQRKKNIMLTVTSGESGDGKTYFCVNLACVYAMASRKTLLVDMDIRKPSINVRFNMSNAAGVTNYLIGERDLEDVIYKLPGVDFDILPSGTVPPNAGELIRSEKLQGMFAELKKKYDYIVIDTSPIGIVADAYPLSLISDVNLFIVRNNKTNKSFFRKIINQLKNDKIENLYTIVNDISIEENKYSRYYSKKYNYAYGYGYATGGGRNLFGKKKKEMADKYFQYYQDDSDL